LLRQPVDCDALLATIAGACRADLPRPARRPVVAETMARTARLGAHPRPSELEYVCRHEQARRVFGLDDDAAGDRGIAGADRLRDGTTTGARDRAVPSAAAP